RLVADPKSRRPGTLRLEYLRILTEALRLEATTKKNLNTLQHLAGFLKKRLSGAEKQELYEAVHRYAAGTAPLIVPKILLAHYAGKYDAHYLKRQYYLNPHPLELMLRNHA
ncbi:MAG TPA: YbgA family protein, partial [Dissulfurispiraceae bacterium]